MNFEDAYKKYVNKTATEEEKEYVLAELAKARSILEMSEKNKSVEFQNTDVGEYMKVKKKFTMKTVLISLIATVLCVMIIAAVTLGVVFGVGISGANDSLKYDKQQAQVIAVDYLKEYIDKNPSFADLDITKANVYHIDKELRLSQSLSKSYYYYEVNISFEGRIRFEIDVNGKTGEVISIELED